MTFKGIAASCKYQLWRMRTLPLIFAVYNFGMLFLGALIVALADGTPFTLSGMAPSGIDLIGGFVLFIGMCCLAGDFINTAAANGVSRATACISVFISSAAASFVIALETSLITPLFSWMTGDTESWACEIYGSAYELSLAGHSEAYIRLRFFAICFFALLTLCAVSMLMTSLFYKLPQWLAIVTVLAIVFVPTLGTIMVFGMQTLAMLFLRVLGFFGIEFTKEAALIANAAKGTLSMSIISAVCLAVSVLLVRRASAKPLPIKGE